MCGYSQSVWTLAYLKQFSIDVYWLAALQYCAVQLVTAIEMSGRKFCLGRHRKNAEFQRQLKGKNKPGRPGKQQILNKSTPKTLPIMSSPQKTAPEVLLPQSLMILKVLYDALPAPLALRLCKLSSCPSMSHQNLIITHEVCVQDDFTWCVSIHGKKLHQIPNTPLSNIPNSNTSYYTLTHLYIG